jgi:hypothetical protein
MRAADAAHLALVLAARGLTFLVRSRLLLRTAIGTCAVKAAQRP